MKKRLMEYARYVDITLGVHVLHTPLFVPLLPLGKENSLTWQDITALPTNLLAVDILQLLAHMGDTERTQLTDLTHWCSWTGLTIACVTAPWQDNHIAYRAEWNGMKWQFDAALLKKIQQDSQLALQIDFPSDHLHYLHKPVGRVVLSSHTKQTDPINHLYYVMGINSFRELITAIGQGGNCLQSTVPYQQAQLDRLYTRAGWFTLTDPELANQFTPVDPMCTCYTCKHFTKAYLHHLAASKSIFGKRLNTIHNVAFWLQATDDLRNALENGTFADALEPTLRYDANINSE